MVIIIDLHQVRLSLAFFEHNPAPLILQYKVIVPWGKVDQRPQIFFFEGKWPATHLMLAIVNPYRYLSATPME